MYRTYKFRLYPNKLQKELLSKIFGCTRFVYNHYLSKIKEKGYQSALSNIKDYTSNLKYKYVFLQDIDPLVIKNTIFNLDSNIKRFRKNLSGYPKYKSKFDNNSYTMPAVYSQTYKYEHKYNWNNKAKNYCNIELDLEKKLINLPKLNLVEIRGYRKLLQIDGRIINATVTLEKTGKYYVSILYEQPEIKNNDQHPNSIVGIDLGIKKLLTLSDGRSIENNKYIEKYEKRIKKLQRELSRKEKNSNNYNKCKKKLAILYSKLKNARNCYLHNITKKITDEYDIIVCEKLKVKNMLQEHKLAKKISDASFSEIIRQLSYKCKYKNKRFYQIDTYYPSSQICNVCGNRDNTYKDLSKREYKCKHCHNEIDRDLNASLNIMYEGLKLYMQELKLHTNELKL